MYTNGTIRIIYFIETWQELTERRDLLLKKLQHERLVYYASKSQHHCHFNILTGWPEKL